MQRRVAGLWLGAAAYASWGLLSPVNKRLLDDFEPMGLNAVRFLFAMVAILPWLGWSGLRESIRLMRNRQVVAANVLANLSLALFAYSLVRLEPTYSTLGFYTAPLWTAALAHVRLGERVGPWFVPAAIGLLGGGYLALFGFDATAEGLDAIGMALAIGSGVAWAFYAVHLRRHATSIPLKPLMGVSYLVGFVFYAALALLVEPTPSLVGLSQATWGWIAVMVALPTLAAFILFNAAVQRSPASQVNILIALELAFTVAFAWLLFGEDFTVVQLLGLLVALASVSGYLWLHESRLRLLRPADKGLA